MRKVSWKAWAAASLALALAGLTAAGAVRLWRKPPAATQLGGRAPTGAERRLVAGGRDVLVIENKRAYRIDAALHVTQLAWPAELILDEVQSAAQKDGLLALTGKAHDHDPDKTFPVVLLADQAQVARIYRPGSDVKRAHVSNVLATGPEEDEPRETRFAVYVQEDNSIYRMPFYSAGRDAEDDRHPIQAWLRAFAVERIVWREGEGPLFLCATERRHLDEKMAPVMPTIAIDIYGHDHENPVVKPLPLVLDADDPPDLEPWRLASRVSAGALVPAPLGQGWLWLDDGQVFVTDGAGNRIDRVARSTSLCTLTDDASPAWILILALIAVGVLLLPILLLRAARAGAEGDALFGTLKIPEGGALETDERGHVEIKAGTCVRIDGHDVELGPGLKRADARLEVPLIDGDAVFVMGRVQGDDAGPFRGSGRKRLAAEGRRHHIGRGTVADFAEQMTARANGSVIKVAVAIAVAAVIVLLRFGNL
jgi:hypothetical protein